MTYKKIKGGVCAPKGFTAGGMACGIKSNGKRDLALIYSETPCAATGVFTTNKVQASCVIINRKQLAGGKAQAIIANSGNANCMTGKRGFDDSNATIADVAKALHVPAGSVLVASTGVIGKPLPIEKIKKAIPALSYKLNSKGSGDAAQSIMTTDKVKKEIAVELSLGGKMVRIGAIAKGAGMIHQNIATILCFGRTDAPTAPRALRAALASAVNTTFNMITIDGDMSTNDMVLVLANGRAGNKKIVEKTTNFLAFTQSLEQVFLELAQKIVRDAEGATKFAAITVKNAASPEDARIAARSVASSNLVKCALFGSDPNWGRIAAAVGYSGATVDPSKMDI